MKSFLIRTVLVLAIVFLASAPAYAARRAPKDNNKYAALVMDAATGRVLYERNATKPLYPASLTKMMTLYLAFEALEEGKLTRNQRIWVSAHAASMSPSKLGLEPDSNIRVEDAILALVTKSANDCAVALAEALGGTESRFARLMTEKAQRLGMNQTIFRNASGLHDRNQVSSARDMAILSRALIKNYPRYYRYFSTKNFTYEGTTFTNHNRLMFSYEGMDGIKTGYVEPSGFNLSASAVRDGRRLIGVVFGGRSASSRNQHMASLLNQGFAKLGDETRIASAEPLPTVRPVKKPLSATTVAYNATSAAQFDSMMGLLTAESGEGDIDPDANKAAALNLAAMSKTTAGIRPEAGIGTKKAPSSPQDRWAIQLGAFSDVDSGNAALHKAAERLPYNLRSLTEPKLVPLETSRGTIYRARLAGLDHPRAASACRILAGNCLVLAEQ